MTKTISLSAPLAFGKQEISALELRTPTAGDLRGIKLTNIMDLDVTTILTLTGRVLLTPVPMATLDALSPADLASVAAGIADFFSPKAGGLTSAESLAPAEAAAPATASQTSADMASLGRTPSRTTR